MYYEIVKQMSRLMADAYDWEEVDGMPRYRWYKTALNSVYMISDCDDKFDIDHADFSDLKYWYDCTEWVAQNDEEALIHIYSERIPPVTQIVKDKYIAGLAALGYFKPCALAKKHLRSYPVPPERTLERKKQKAIKFITDHVISPMKGCDKWLEKLEKEQPDKLEDDSTEMRQALSVLLSIEFILNGERLDTALMHLEWMRLHAPETLTELLSITVKREIKDQLIQLLTTNEFYHLRNLADKCIQTKPAARYSEIQPYRRSKEDIFGDYIDLNEEED